MSMEKKKSVKLDELDLFVRNELLPLLDKYPTFLFFGTLGSGKTTLIRKLLRSLGVTESIVSPTFTFVNVYTNPLKEIFYHFDLYRVESIEQFFEYGFNELLELESARCFIEWPEIVRPLLKDNAVSIDMQYIDADTRLITIQYFSNHLK